MSRKYRRQEAGEDDELEVLVAVDQSAEPDPAQHDGELEARAGEVDLHPCSARHSQRGNRAPAERSEAFQHLQLGTKNAKNYT